MKRRIWPLACLAGLLAVAGVHGQTPAPAIGRALTIVPDSVTATADWGTIVDRMVRGDELRARLQLSDTLIAGRSIEQLMQQADDAMYANKRAKRAQLPTGDTRSA